MGKSYNGKVVYCREEKKDSNVFELKIFLGEDKVAERKPGQYVVLEPKHERSVMPRPFSVVDVNDNFITVLIKVVGKNTEAYSRLKSGDDIEVLNISGNEIEIDSDAESYIYVGGGIGSVALVMHVKKMINQGKKVKVLLGARDEAQLSGESFFKEIGAPLFTITETGEKNSGYVTDLLEGLLIDDEGRSAIISCGPKQMLGKVSEICEQYNNKCFAILEEVMACGMGVCKGCSVPGRDGSSVKYVCTDGPAIDADFIDWDKFAPKTVIELSEKISETDVKMEVSLGGINLNYPTINASGTLAVKAIEEDLFDISKLGALSPKGVTVLGRVGNEMPRTCETPAGMINSIGLTNIGKKGFFERELPQWIDFGLPVFPNISGFSIEEYVELAIEIEKSNVEGFEVNISCPNIKHGGITFGINPEAAFEVVNAVRRKTDKFMIVKLTPNVTDIVSIAKAVKRAGADAISLINTVQAMSINPYTRKPKIKLVMGGLSGPAIRPIAVRMVHQIFQAEIGLPIIGMGGIEDGESASEFFIAGANIIAVGTGGFSNRNIFCDIDKDLRKIVSFNGFSSINEMVGSLIMGE